MERPAPLELSRENGQEMKAKRKGEGRVQKHQILEGFDGSSLYCNGFVTTIFGLEDQRRWCVPSV